MLIIYQDQNNQFKINITINYDKKTVRSISTRVLVIRVHCIEYKLLK